MTYRLITSPEMSAEIENDAPGAGSVLTTNFDTYTLILQLVLVPSPGPLSSLIYLQ